MHLLKGAIHNTALITSQVSRSVPQRQPQSKYLSHEPIQQLAMMDVD